MFEQILETGSSRPLKGRSLGGGGLHIYIYICVHKKEAICEGQAVMGPCSPCILISGGYVTKLTCITACVSQQQDLNLAWFSSGRGQPGAPPKLKQRLRTQPAHDSLVQVSPSQQVCPVISFHSSIRTPMYYWGGAQTPLHPQPDCTLSKDS